LPLSTLNCFVYVKKLIILLTKNQIKIKKFWPIVGDGICEKLFFGLFLVTLDHKLVLHVKKSAEIGQFTMTVIKKWSLWAGPFLEKCHTEYFLICHFGKSLGCLEMPHHWFSCCDPFGKPPWSILFLRTPN
jgi:hypothetical protein